MKQSNLLIAGFVIATLLAAWGGLRDISNTAHGGAIDLRNRVTGARVASAGVNPYTYKWARNHPGQFCDVYNEPGGLMSKTTVTPWSLAAHSIFNKPNYRDTQWRWLLIQYAALILGGWVWWLSYKHERNEKVKPKQTRQIFLWAIGLVLIYCATPSWRQHVDHGQVYVVYAAMFLWLYGLAGVAERRNSGLLAVLEGALGAFTFGSRPAFLGQFAEPVASKRWMTFAGMSIGIALVYLVPTKLFGTAIWVQYKQAMEVHSELYLDQVKPYGKSSFPGTIEGVALDVIAGYSNKIPFVDTSVFKTISFQLPAQGLLLGWLLLMTVGLLVLMVKKASRAMIWWSVMAWLMVGDFLLPAFRNPYNNVLILPLILIGISALTDRARTQMRWIYVSGMVLVMMQLTWLLRFDFLKGWRWYLPVPSLLIGGLSIAVIIYSLRAVFKGESLSGENV